VGDNLEIGRILAAVLFWGLVAASLYRVFRPKDESFAALTPAERARRWQPAPGGPRQLEGTALPELGQTEPDRFYRRFEVTANLALTEIQKLFCFAVAAFIVATLLYSLYENGPDRTGLFQPWGPADVLDIVLALVLCGLVAYISPYFAACWGRAVALGPQAVVLEVFDGGLWFNETRLFVPYERLLAVNVEPAEETPKTRFLSFTAQMSAGDYDRLGGSTVESVARGLDLGKDTTLTVKLPVADGRTTPDFDETVRRIAELATAKCAATQLPPPVFHVFPKNGVIA
jgi:hypothetical protein